MPIRPEPTVSPMVTQPPDNLRRKLDDLDHRYEALGCELLDPEVAADHHQVRRIATRRSALETIVLQYRAWKAAAAECADLEQALDDPDLAPLAREELETARARADDLLDRLERHLVTADERAVASVILEIRSGVGGEEAALWARDLLKMYTRFASRRGWSTSEVDLHPSDLGGLRLAIVQVSGEGVWAELGYEGGTHQVKRIPEAEAQGRIHTSTATVAVLPEPEEIELELDPADVKESITTAQGPPAYPPAAPLEGPALR